MNRVKTSWMAAAIAAVAVTWAPASGQPIRVSVDLREAPRRIFHTRLVCPVTGATMSLSYPKWIQGTHSPAGPLMDLVGLRVSAAGRPIEWRRDDVDLYTIRFQPGDVGEVEVAFDFVFPLDGGANSEEVSTTEKLAVLNWYTVMMYPTGANTDSVRCEAQILLPSQWKYATALRGHSGPEGASDVRFESTSITTLLDSPVLAGINLRSIELTPSGDPRPVWLDMACDSREGLEMPPEQVAHYKRLVAESDALFGARHYRHYHFLVAMSDEFYGSATEHHESSDNRVFERTWLESAKRLSTAALLSHEYVHSWNGKYRRPSGIATPNPSVAMRDELLWVYEGLTEYLGIVLAARCGNYTLQQCRDEIVSTAAYLDREPGRNWRPLVDTAREASLLWGSPRQWRSWRRGADYYAESVLIWLEADVTIRKLTNGRRSLDDFCRAFFGGASGPPRVVPYGFDDVVRGLDAVAHHDWRSFLEERYERVQARAPLAGLEAGGWRPTFRDSASEAISAAENAYDYVNLYYSLGLRVATPSGTFADAFPGSPAARAGIAPGMTLVAVNGRKWSKDGLIDALKAARTGHDPIELLCSNDEFYRTFRIDYHEGPRYPWPERIPGRQDLLAKILEPRRARSAAGTPGVH